MESELMPDYQAEAFYRYLIPENVFDGYEDIKKEADYCVVSCKKGTPRDLNISHGAAMAKADKNYFKDEVGMIAPCRKNFFEKILIGKGIHGRHI